MDYRQFKVESNVGCFPHYHTPLVNYDGRYPRHSVTPAHYPWYNVHKPSDSNWKWGPDPYGYYRFKLWQQACAISERQAALRHTLIGPRLNTVPRSYPLSSQDQYPTYFAQYPAHDMQMQTRNIPNPAFVCPINAQDNSSVIRAAEQQDYSPKGDTESNRSHENTSPIFSPESPPITAQIPNPSLFRPYAKSEEPVQISDGHVSNLNTATQSDSNPVIHHSSDSKLLEGLQLQTQVLSSDQYNSGHILHVSNNERLANPSNFVADQHDVYGELANVRNQEKHAKSPTFTDNEITSLTEQQDHWNFILQNQTQALWRKPVSTPVHELMNNLMQGRASKKSQDVTNDLLDSAPALALDLLEEECMSRFRHEHLEDTFSANIDLKGLKGDRDLEELIMMDTELDKILESIDKQDEIRQREMTYDKTRNVVQPRKRQKIKHVCDICGKNFACRANKTVHMRIHSGETPYKCEYCGKRFKQRSTMTAHVRIHTGDKPYVCDVCKRAFSDYSSWRKHLRLHSGEKPFRCTVCNKRFVQCSNRDRHMKRHTMNSKKTLKKSS